MRRRRGRGMIQRGRRDGASDATRQMRQFGAGDFRFRQIDFSLFVFCGHLTRLSTHTNKAKFLESSRQRSRKMPFRRSLGANAVSFIHPPVPANLSAVCIAPPQCLRLRPSDLGVPWWWLSGNGMSDRAAPHWTLVWLAVTWILVAVRTDGPVVLVDLLRVHTAVASFSGLPATLEPKLGGAMPTGMEVMRLPAHICIDWRRRVSNSRCLRVCVDPHCCDSSSRLPRSLSLVEECAEKLGSKPIAARWTEG